MAWTKYQFVLAVMMVVTGSINTINIKWADMTKSKGVDGEVREFHHPFFQALCMFVGEFSCYIVFKILYLVFKSRGDGKQDEHELTRGNRDFNPFIFLIPAMCDMSATSLMFLGLNLTYASSFQMFRGSVIIFVSILSILFLHRVLKITEWIGIFCVIVGLTIVGIADFISKEADTERGQIDIIIGDVIIVAAQIVTAIQMVVEEKFVVSQDIPPLQAVGWEGFFGVVVLSLLHIPLYYTLVDPPISQKKGGRLEEAIDAFVQIGNHWEVAVATIGLIVSIAFFNFAGISVTKELSATTRQVLDSFRTIVIWIFSLSFFGQIFHYLQVIGFILLLIGLFTYNGVTFRTCFPKKKPLEEGEQGTTGQKAE